MINTEIINNIVIASFVNTTSINVLVSERAKDELKLQYAQPNTKLVLDLDGISFIDSSGFGIFISIMKVANNTNGYFKICNINSKVLELFKLLQLHNILEIYNCREEALESFIQ